MVDVAKPTYQADPRLLQIRANIAHRLGLPLDNVTVKVGRDANKEEQGRFVRYAEYGGSGDRTQDLIITVHKQGMAIEFERNKEDLIAKLGEMQPLVKYAQMMPEDKMALHVETALKKLVAGTNFNMKLIDDSPVFDPKAIANGMEVQDYALSNVTHNAYGIEGNLHFARAKGEDVTQTIKRFEELEKGREAHMLKIYEARAIHYAEKNLRERGLNEQEKQKITEDASKAGLNVDEALAKALNDKITALKAKIHADMAKLKITWTIGEDGNLSFTVRSTEQQAAFDEAIKTKSKWQIDSTPPSNADELSNSNPLTSTEVGLTTTVIPAQDGKEPVQPQLKKLLARGLFFDEKKNVVPDAVKIMGRADIKAAIATELMKNVLPKHPEKRSEIEAILNGDLFKNHTSWHGVAGTAGSSRPKPVFSEPTSDDTVEISFTFPTHKEPEKNQLLQVVNGLAGLPMNNYNKDNPYVEDVSGLNDNKTPANKATNTPVVAAAGAAAACEDGQMAVAGAVGGAVAGADGEAAVGAAAVAGCVPNKPPVTIGNTVITPNPVSAYSPEIARDFLKSKASSLGMSA